jgi:hypothetical protein
MSIIITTRCASVQWSWKLQAVGRRPFHFHVSYDPLQNLQIRIWLHCAIWTYATVITVKAR